MIALSVGKSWSEIQEKDPKLKQLAIKAGCADNPKRAEELKDAFAYNCGYDICRSQEELELCKYMFGYNFDEKLTHNATIGRVIAAYEAKQTEL